MKNQRYNLHVMHPQRDFFDSPFWILLENAHTDGVFPNENLTTTTRKSSCYLDKVFIMGFALKSRISKINNIKYILIVHYFD